VNWGLLVVAVWLALAGVGCIVWFAIDCRRGAAPQPHRAHVRNMHAEVAAHLQAAADLDVIQAIAQLPAHDPR
jgi:hypothetical protein